MKFYCPPSPQPSPQELPSDSGAGPGAAPTQSILKQKPTSVGSALISSPSDLVVVRSLGSGGQAQVVMAQVANSNVLVAVKIFSLANKTARYDFNTELRNLLSLPWSPLLVNLIAAVSDSTNLSLVLELMPNGNFSQLIDRIGPFSQMDACFYYCNIVCAIEFIHSHGLVSRDVKPENFLIGYDGYLVMTDLGIAEREGEGGSWLNIGTPQYMAPELIQQGYPVGRAVDWWASGVMLYEMLTQTMPFQGDTDELVFHNILTLNYKWPEEPVWGNGLKHIISRLLTFEPQHRLGYADASQVMEHPWLSHVDWTWMRYRVDEVPWTPGRVEPIGKLHTRPMPDTRSMGDMKVRHPPRYLRYDDRYTERGLLSQTRDSD